MLLPPVHSVTHVRLREIPRERGKHIVTRVDIAVVGVHVLDTHVVGIATIPEGSDGQLVESIKISAAGTAGGTAVVLSRLGAHVRSYGAVGTDPIGDILLGLL